MSNGTDFIPILSDVDASFDAINLVIALLAESWNVPLLILTALWFVWDIVSQFLPLPAIEGKPNYVDTMYVAQNLMKSANPACQLWGTEMARLWTDYGIVLSSSDTGDQTLIGHGREQFKFNIAQQYGFDSTTTGNIATTIESLNSGFPIPLPHTLDQPAPTGTGLYGPAQVLTDYNNQLAANLAKGQVLADAQKHAWKWVLNHELLVDLWWVTTGLTQPTTLIPFQVPPKLPASQMPPPPPPVPPGPVLPTNPQPCIPNPDGNQDELSDGLNCVSQNLLVVQSQLAQIIAQLQTGTPVTGGGVSDTCCNNVVAAIAGVTAQLTALASSVAGMAGATAPAPVDLSGIITALGNLLTALNSYPPVWNAVATTLQNSLGSIATAIGSAPATNVQGIIDVLSKIFTTIDVPMPLLQQLAADGYIDPNYLSLLGQGDAGPALATGVATNFQQWWRKFFTTWFGVDLTTPSASLGAGAPIQNHLKSAFKSYLNSTDSFVKPALDPLLKTIAAALAPSGAVSIGSIGNDGSTPIAEAVSVAITAGVASWLVSLIGFAGGPPLAEIVGLVAGAVGFEEIGDVTIGPLVRHGIGKVAEMKARSQFRQDLPGVGALANLYGRGIITQAQFEAWVPYLGLPVELVTPTETASQHGFSARQLIRVFETGLFTTADITDELTFGGMRPSSQARYQLATPWLATSPQRAKLESAIEEYYVAGLMTDAEFTAAIDSAESNTNRDNLLLTAMQYKKLTAETKKIEAEYSTLFKAGLLDDATYRSDLSAIGLQPDMVNTVAGVAEAAANATLQKKTLAQAAALAKTTATEARKTAMYSFAEGTIDAAGLTAALLLTGLTTTQAASWVSLATLQQVGKLKWLYGLQVTPPQASLLSARVTAISDQRTAGLITDAQMIAQLTALGIPAVWSNALTATADAKTAVTKASGLIPVTTT